MIRESNEKQKYIFVYVDLSKLNVDSVNLIYYNKCNLGKSPKNFNT